MPLYGWVSLSAAIRGWPVCGPAGVLPSLSVPGRTYLKKRVGRSAEDRRGGVVEMPDPLKDPIDRLSAEFCPLVDPDDVTDVVAQCCRELNTARKRARPELVEAVARKRLLDITADTYTGVVDHCGWLPGGISVRPVMQFGK